MHFGLRSLLFASAFASVAAAGPPEPRVRVLSEGSGDKAVLRYKYVAGATSTQFARIESDITLQAEDGPKAEFSYPVFELKIEQTVREVKEDGTVTVEARIVDAEASGGPGVPDELLESARKSVPTLEGVSWTVTHTSRGIVTEFSVSRPAGLDEAMAGIIDGMEAGMATAVTILPDEAVGVGARWEVESTEEHDGEKEEHVHTYELTARESDQVSLERRHTAKGPPPPFRPPGLPEEVKVEGVSGEYESLGKAVERLDKTWWVEHEGKAETVHKYLMTGPDGTTKRVEVTQKSREIGKMP